jgi:hypothetical protein
MLARMPAVGAPIRLGLGVEDTAVVTEDTPS